MADNLPDTPDITPSTASDSAAAFATAKEIEGVLQRHYKELTRKLSMHWHRIRVVFMWFVCTMFVVVASVLIALWLWHLGAPEKWHFMTAENIAAVKGILLGIITGGVAGRVFDKVKDKLFQ